MLVNANKTVMVNRPTSIASCYLSREDLVFSFQTSMSQHSKKNSLMYDFGESYKGRKESL